MACLFHLFRQMQLVRDIEFPRVQIDWVLHIIIFFFLVIMLVEPIRLLLFYQWLLVIYLHAPPKVDPRTLNFKNLSICVCRYSIKSPR